MSFEEELRAWLIYFNHTRGVGHTYAAVHGVKNTKGALLVGVNLRHADQMVGIAFSDTDKLKGLESPVVFDNYTIMHLMGRALSERIDKRRVENAIDGLGEMWHHFMDPDEVKEYLRKELGL